MPICDLCKKTADQYATNFVVSNAPQFKAFVLLGTKTGGERPLLEDTHLCAPCRKGLGRILYTLINDSDSDFF